MRIREGVCVVKGIDSVPILRCIDYGSLGNFEIGTSYAFGNFSRFGRGKKSIARRQFDFYWDFDEQSQWREIQRSMTRYVQINFA